MKTIPALFFAAAATLCCVGAGGDAAPGARDAALPPPLDAGRHRFCGWIYPSSNEATRDVAYDTFAAHAAELDVVHPVWWHVASPTRIERHEAGFEDPRVIANTTRGGARTRLVPTIEATDRPDLVYAHRMINDPALRRQHVAAVAAMVVDHGYDGVDVDYEHLETALEPGQTRLTEQHAFSAFVAELAAALHAAGKTLSLAVPVEGSERGVYSYDALSAAADEVHVMGYDYHYAEGSHAGPVAPLGWVREVVAYIDGIDGGRRRERFILGVPNYGLVGPHAALCNPTSRCLALAGDAYRTTTHHMDHCSSGHDDPGRAPNQTLPDGEELYFDDIASLEEKVEAAEEGGLGGVAYWSIGGEPDRPGPRTFFEMVRAHFPRQ
jgi:spore germination protein YaaH